MAIQDSNTSSPLGDEHLPPDEPVQMESIWRFSRSVVNRLTHLASDTDIEGTIKGIRSGVVLQGSNLWILICSTIIACIGLDTNSPAVIIGAMLISPLMSPILGIGLHTAINDREYLVKSLRNFAVALGLSLFVSVLYFMVTPFGLLTDEMRGRTSPTLLDALVAFFGGLAGIIAGSRSDKTNAIPGVAIATALMPPLCTSGYGLAKGQWEVFGGAFYLFFINAVLISISTYMIVKLLRFPLHQELDPMLERKAKRIVYTSLFLLLVPSLYFLFTSLQNIAERTEISNFISRHIHDDVAKGVDWSYIHDNPQHCALKVYYFGKFIRPDSVSRLEVKLQDVLKSHPILRFTAPDSLSLDLTPTDRPPDEEKEVMQKEIADLKAGVLAMRQIQEEDVIYQQQQIDSLLIRLAEAEHDSIPIRAIQQEAKAFFPELEEIVFGRAFNIQYDSAKKPYDFVATIEWNKSMNRRKDRKEWEKRLYDYLSAKLMTKKINLTTK